ncbi:GAF and ANTAR domain-containing protein [Nocardioides lentus]|uniref:GAF and ANTAR domain-containing protein n=1 Tax=Nocardioides lentus TaxID=338077 RepID=A0ABN2PR87_9ACTN
MDHDAESFAALARKMQPSSGEDGDTAATIIGLAATTLPGVHGASITLRVRHGRYTSLGASAPAVEKADAAQHELREGPCVDAVEAGEWFHSPDLAHDARWPRWGPKAAELGFGSLLGLPLVGGREPAASLNLYSRDTGQFEDHDALDHAILFATHAAMALQAAHLISGLETAVTSRHVIGMAQGVLVERHGLLPHQAFALLQRVSATTNTKLRRVAEQLLATGQLPGEVTPQDVVDA